MMESRSKCRWKMLRGRSLRQKTINSQEDQGVDSNIRLKILVVTKQVIREVEKHTR